MSQYCRLCLNTCDDYESIYDLNGKSYKTVNLLFNFRWLLASKDNPSRVICLLCWRLISNFHNYRESVKKALANLRHGVRKPLKLTALQLEIIYDDETENRNHNVLVKDQQNLESAAKMDDVSIKDQQNLQFAAEMDDISVNDHPKLKFEAEMEYVSVNDQQNLKSAAQMDDILGNDQPKLKSEAEMDDVLINDQTNLMSESEMHILKQNNVMSGPIQSVDEPMLMKELVTSDNSASINETSQTIVCCNDNSKTSATTISNVELQLEQFHKQMISTVTLEDENQSIELSNISKLPTSSATVSEGKTFEIISIDDSSNESKAAIDENDVIDYGYGFVIDELDDDQHQEVDTNEQTLHEYDTSTSESSATTSKHSRKLSPEVLNATIAKWRKMLICYACRGTYSNFMILREHFSQHHPGKPCYIRCCNRDFLHRSKLAEHARFHLNPQCLKCDLCAQTFATKATLRRHRQRYHSNPKEPVMNDTRRDFFKKLSSIAR